MITSCHILLCSPVVDNDEPTRLVVIFFFGCIKIEDNDEPTKLVIVFFFNVEQASNMC